MRIHHIKTFILTWISEFENYANCRAD